MLPGDSAALRKARGAFYTPESVARFIAGWAVRSASDDVLEPSCGEAVFLHEAGRLAPSPSGRRTGRLDGVELHADTARASQRALRAEGIPATISTGDFFLTEPGAGYDAVIGNPPYVRYQDFSGEHRARARAAALRAGVSLTGLASSWAAFTLHSCLHLRPGGRLGLVLPAELLSVNYAASVRQYLMDHFGSVRLVLFVERVFPGVLEEVVLLLADGYDPTGAHGTSHCEVIQVQNAEALPRLGAGRLWSPPARNSKWTASLMLPDGLSAYSSATAGPEFGVLEDWGDTTLGMVTGNNKYFALSPRRVREIGLPASDLVPLSPPGSSHLRNLAFTAGARDALGEHGSATWLFRPTATPSAAGRRYISAGDQLGVHLAYKCRVRSPWWRVPYLAPADLFLTYMNADTPRICANRAGVHHLNSVHGVYLRPSLRRDGLSLLPLAALNSVTLLGAETVGRAYGGGMLKIEPREADHLPVPAPSLVRSCRSSLAALRPVVLARLAAGALLDAVTLVDEVLLEGALRLPPAQIQSLRTARADLAARRLARGKDARAIT